MQFPISIDDNKLSSFCQKWKVTEMSLFGSVAQGHARPNSDVDILISFTPDAGWSLLDHVAMQEEMSTLLQRNVDLVTRRSIERSTNEIRKRSILENTVPLYVTRQGADS